MENWGLVTYREVDLLISSTASSGQKQRVCTVVTHELAHQWFGNLVTMKYVVVFVVVGGGGGGGGGVCMFCFVLFCFVLFCFVFFGGVL